MTDRPIIFSAPMVRALLDGRKTQTRRIVKITAVMGNKVAIEWPDEKLIELEDGEFRRGICHYESTSALSGPYRLPYAHGDRLWVRENFALHRIHDNASPSKIMPTLLDAVWFSADPRPDYKIGKCRPSIHMPRWASRITLIVTDVRVQRLQEISEEDAIAEGLGCITKDGALYKWGMPDRDGYPGTDDDGWPWDRWKIGHKAAFAELWDGLHGADSWGANPWVVALTFTVGRDNIDEVAP